MADQNTLLSQIENQTLQSLGKAQVDEALLNNQVQNTLNDLTTGFQSNKDKKDFLTIQYEQNKISLTDKADFTLKELDNSLNKALSSYDFNINKNNLDLAFLESSGQQELDQLNKNIDIQRKQNDLSVSNQLSQISEQQNQLGFSIKRSENRIEGQEQVLGEISGLENLLNERQLLTENSSRNRLQASQIAEEQLLSTQRGIEFRQNQEIALKQAVGGDNDLISLSENYSKSVGFGIELGQAISKIDQENIKQQSILIDKAFNLNRINQQEKELNIRKIQINTNIKSILNSIDSKKSQIRFLNKQKTFVKNLGKISSEKLDLQSSNAEDRYNTRLNNAKKLNKLQNEYINRISSIDKGFNILRKGFIEGELSHSLNNLKNIYDYKIKNLNIRKTELINKGQMLAFKTAYNQKLIDSKKRIANKKLSLTQKKLGNT